MYGSLLDNGKTERILTLFTNIFSGLLNNVRRNLAKPWIPRHFHGTCITDFLIIFTRNLHNDGELRKKPRGAHTDSWNTRIHGAPSFSDLRCKWGGACQRAPRVRIGLGLHHGLHHGLHTRAVGTDFHASNRRKSPVQISSAHLDRRS